MAPWRGQAPSRWRDRSPSRPRSRARPSPASVASPSGPAPDRRGEGRRPSARGTPDPRRSNVRAPFAILLTRPERTWPGPISMNVSTPSTTSALDALLPANRSRHLTHQPFAALRGRRHDPGVHVVDEGDRGVGERQGGQVRREAHLRRHHQRAVEGRGDGEPHRPLGARGLARLRGAVHGRRVARDHDLARGVHVGGRDDLPLGGRPQAFSIAARSRPRIAAMAPSPTGTASCMYSPGARTVVAASRRVRLPAATRAEYSPRLCPATKSATTPRAARARWAAMLARQDGRLGVGRELEVSLGADETEARQGEAERRVGLLEDGSALGERLGELASPCRPSATPGPGRQTPSSCSPGGGRLLPRPEERAAPPRCSGSLRS